MFQNKPTESVTYGDIISSESRNVDWLCIYNTPNGFCYICMRGYGTITKGRVSKGDYEWMPLSGWTVVGKNKNMAKFLRFIYER